MYITLFLLISLTIVFYLRHRNIFLTLLFTCILFCFFLLIFDKKLSFKVEIKKRIPVILMVDSSRSMKEYEINLKEWVKYADKTYYFSDTISKNPNTLNPEFTSVFNCINRIKKENGNNCQLVVITDLKDNASTSEISKTENITIILPEEKITNKSPYIYKIKIPDFIPLNNIEKITLSIYSSANTTEKIILKIDGKNFLTREIKLKKGENEIELPIKFSLKGEKRVEIAMKNQKITRMVYVTEELHNIFIATSTPNEEFTFIKRLLKSLKWIKLTDAAIRNKKERIKIQNKYYDCLIFINILPEHFNSPINFKKLSNSIFRFTLIDKDSQLFLHLLTNNEKLFYSRLTENLHIIELPEKKNYIVYGEETWKWKLKEALFELKENKFENFWLNLLSRTLNKENVPVSLYKLNYILGETASVDTSKTGIFKYENLEYIVSENISETFNPPTKETRTNGLTIKRLEEIKSVKNFLDELRKREKIIYPTTINIRFTNNLYFFTIFIILILLLWANINRKKYTDKGN